MFGWGTSDFLTTKSSRKIGSVLTFFWTQIISFFLALIYFIFNFKNFEISSISKYIFIIIVAAFLFTVGTLSFFKGLIIGQASIVCPLMASWAMIAVTLGIIFLRELLKINQIFAIILILFGIILISTSLKDLLNKNKLIFFAGVKEGIISMFCYGFAVFLLTLAIKSLGWFLPGFVLRLFIIIFIILYATIVNKQSLGVSFSSSSWVPIILIGFFDIIAFFAYSFGVSVGYSSLVAPVAASSPLVTIILARIFLKEKLALNQIFGIIITISGLILISVK